MIINEDNSTPAAPVSEGEKRFDWGVYGGIAGLGVFIGTLPVAYWAKYGGGAKWFANCIKRIQKMGFSEHVAEQAMNTCITGSVGNLAIIPIKIAEDHKCEIVTAINNSLGEKTDVSHLREEPKQSWWSLIKGRMVAYAAVLTCFEGAVGLFGGERFNKFEERFSERVICRPFNKPTHLNGQPTKWFLSGRIAALDVFATAGAATLLYIGSRIFARREKEGEAAALPATLPETPAIPVAAPAATPKNLYTHLTRPSPEILAESVVKQQAGREMQPVG